MKLLLDSHALLWAIYEPRKLSEAASAAITNVQNTKFLSDASLWELSLKIAKGKLAYESSQTTFRERIKQMYVQPLPISREHIEKSVTLPPIQADPFDRMLIAQAHSNRWRW